MSIRTSITQATLSRTLTRRSFIRAAALAAIGAGLAGCSTQASGQTAASGAKSDIKVAVLAREEPDVNFVAEKLKGTYDVTAQVFSDNNAINESTIDGSVDVNYFQNKAYLDSWNQSKGSDLTFYEDPIFSTIDILVSKKYSTVEALPDGAQILVANDNANRARELKLLETGGLIKLNPDVQLPTTLDITDNPKNIQVVEVDPRSRVGAFADVDAMVAPSITVYQMNDPDVTVDKALLAETPDVYRTYGGTGLVVKPENQDAQWLKDLYDAFRSDDYKQFIKDTYKGAKAPYTD